MTRSCLQCGSQIEERLENWPSTGRGREEDEGGRERERER